jgi:MoxR-like ATPase
MSDVRSLQLLLKKYYALKNEISKVIVGQEIVIEQILISIFSGGHSLLVGVPGLAKTLMVNTISNALGLDFKRIQFTPDLMPSDILGSEILDHERQFKFIKGPVFSNILLADEINRTPPKTQSALLEAMQERSVTIGGKHYSLDSPYFVLATQNPIEQEGTYPLPEAQLDRFMFSINLQYPTFDEEVEVVKRTTSKSNSKVDIIFSAEEILDFQKLIMKIPVADNVINYAVTMVGKSRPDSIGSNSIVKQYVDWGAGPRASQNLILAAKTFAVINNKLSPDIEDVQAVAIGILRQS